jgi:hypothetical protein
MGFVVTEEGFTFSGFPSRWAPAISAFFLGGLSLVAGNLVLSHKALQAAVLAIAGIMLAGAAGRYLARAGVLNFPLDRMSSVNLVARPANGEARMWLVAHLDSKSQTIPMLLRIASVAIFAVAFTMLFVVAVVISTLEQHSVLSGPLASFAQAVAVLSAIALLPLMLCFIGNRSQGALDNASGVAAVLLAAERLKGAGVGILITSGEELGLAGARSFAASANPASVAINCDTLDSAGRFLVMRSAPLSSRLEAALAHASRKTGVTARVGRMLPGVLADNIAFTDAGWDSLTISRGNLATLGRVHTSRDRADSFDGTGIAQAALLIVALAEELT